MADRSSAVQSVEVDFQILKFFPLLFIVTRTVLIRKGVIALELIQVEAVLELLHIALRKIDLPEKCYKCSSRQQSFA